MSRATARSALDSGHSGRHARARGRPAPTHHPAHHRVRPGGGPAAHRASPPPHVAYPQPPLPPPLPVRPNPPRRLCTAAAHCGHAARGEPTSPPSLPGAGASGRPVRLRTPARRRGCAPYGARMDNGSEVIGKAETIGAIKASCDAGDHTAACEASWDMGRVAQPARGGIQRSAR